MGKYFGPSCKKHKWKLKSVTEADADKKVDGQKVYICPRCLKTRIKLIP